MANLIRKLASELTGFVWNRRVAPRKKLRVPVVITLEPFGQCDPAKTVRVKGETKDLSSSGVAVVVPTIRMREKYLVGEDRTLYAEIELPNGKIRAELVGARYEQQLDIHNSVANYLIGARITNISEEDRALYEEYLKYGDKLRVNAVRETDFPVAEVSK